MDLKTQYFLQNGWVFENYLSFYEFQIFPFFNIIGSKVIVVWESQYIFHDTLVCSNGVSSRLLNIDYSNAYFPAEWRMQTYKFLRLKYTNDFDWSSSSCAEADVHTLPPCVI